MFKLVRQVVSVALVASAAGLAPASAQETKPQDAFQRHVLPLLDRYCVECHQKDAAEGGIAFDDLTDRKDAMAAGRTWLRVLDALEGRIMPPADSRQPSLEEASRILDWIQDDFLASQCRTGVS